MIFKFTIVLLVSNIANAGQHGVRNSLPVPQHFGPNLKSSQIPTNALPQVSQIPDSLRTQLTSTPLLIPQSIPEHLLTLSRTAEFQIPQNIPTHLLTITGSSPVVFAAPQAVAQPLAQPLSQPIPMLSRSSLLSPAQKGRSQISSSLPQNVPLLQAPAVSQGVSVPRFESNAYTSSQSLPTDVQNRGDIGFSTPVKPLNFAPNLPEVQNQLPQSQPIAQSIGTMRAPEVQQPIRAPEVQQPIRAPEVQQPIRAPEVQQPIRAPEVQQPIRAPEVQQPIRAPEVQQPIRAPEVQQRIETTNVDLRTEQQPNGQTIQNNQPLSQLRTDTQVINRPEIPFGTRINSPLMGLSSYSF